MINFINLIFKFFTMKTRRCAQESIRFSCKIQTQTPVRKSSFVVFKSPIAFKKRGKEPYDKFKRTTVITLFFVNQATSSRSVISISDISKLRNLRYHTFIIKRVVIGELHTMPLLLL